MDNGWRSAKPRKKTQAEKNNDKRMRNSYFTQQYEAFGENFSNFKTAQDVKKDSFRIFKSLADCAIDLDVHIKCFEDPIFVSVLRDVSYEKMMYHWSTQMGLEQYINSRLLANQYIESFIYESYASHQKSTECYTLLYQAFLNIQLTHDTVGTLSTLMPLLNKYRYSL